MSDGESSMPERRAALARTLEGIQMIRRRGDNEGEPEAQTLAYSLLEIAGSCKEFLEKFEPLVSLDPAAAEDRIGDLREVLRHVIYHVNDSLYLRLVNPSLSESAPSGEDDRQNS